MVSRWTYYIVRSVGENGPPTSLRPELVSLPICKTLTCGAAKVQSLTTYAYIWQVYERCVAFAFHGPDLCSRVGSDQGDPTRPNKKNLNNSWPGLTRPNMWDFEHLLTWSDFDPRCCFKPPDPTKRPTFWQACGNLPGFSRVAYSYEVTPIFLKSVFSSF